MKLSSLQSCDASWGISISLWSFAVLRVSGGVLIRCACTSGPMSTGVWTNPRTLSRLPRKCSLEDFTRNLNIDGSRSACAHMSNKIFRTNSSHLVVEFCLACAAQPQGEGGWGEGWGRGPSFSPVPLPLHGAMQVTFVCLCYFTTSKLSIPIYDLFQPLRIFNTWMGDQSKLLYLKEVIRVVSEDNLLERARDTGKFLLDGLRELEVQRNLHCHVFKKPSWKL